jgi:Na+-driven multidrug efflux pump
MGSAFLLVQRRAGFDRPHPAAMRPLMRIGAEIAVRTSALTGSFLLASAVLARVGAASLGAHLIAFQLWIFNSLVLDALAVAAQVMVGRALGGHDARAARAAAVRVVVWSVAVGTLFGVVLGPLGGVVPALFTDDHLVRERAQEIWWIFAATMPANGAVFALDGILIGAGDTRFLMWGMLAAAAAYVPITLLTLHFGWGIRGVWLGVAALIAVRLVTCLARFVSGRWAALGAT